MNLPTVHTIAKERTCASFMDNTVYFDVHVHNSKGALWSGENFTPPSKYLMILWETPRSVADELDVFTVP